MILLTKLFLAHLLGDFILQPNSWVKEKEVKKLKSKTLYLHVVVHGTLTMLLVWDIKFLPGALIILSTHYLIDATKILLQKPETKRLWFAIDQALHVIMLLTIWFVWEKKYFNVQIITDNLVLITGVIFLTNPSSVMIKMLISQWSPISSDSETASLEDGGKFIGILERLFVLVFVLTNHWEAVGFLLAAKSVFRFGDLKDAHDRKLTEYVLIGTLLSFGIAIGVGLIVSFF